MKRFIKWFAIACGLSGMALVLLGWWVSAPRPQGEPSPAADALAHKMQTAVGYEHWAKTGALRWTFAGKRTHLWDKTRGFAQVRWGTTEVRLDLRSATLSGTATEAGAPLQGERLTEALTSAYKDHINDRFWLYPFATFFDAGVTRAIGEDEEGREGLIIQYGQGGVTPGDTYLWFIGPDHRPTSWRMWVKILPVGGVASGWSDWKTLATGITVATAHSGTVSIPLTEVAAAPTLSALTEGKDPFAALLKKRAPSDTTSQPTRPASAAAPKIPTSAAATPPPIGEKLQLTDAQWRKKLSPERYRVLRQQGTEPAFTGVYWDEKSEGTYTCAACGAPLYSSAHKFKSGTGWPSYTQAIEAGRVLERPDGDRTELVCARCGGHLGHVFNDGPAPTGRRHCINSASLRLSH